MQSAKVRKQISIFLPISDWRLLRLEAAREGVPITELCRRWICPELAKLKSNHCESDSTRSRAAT